MNPIIIKLNLMRINKQKIFEGKNGAKYIDLVMFENTRGPDAYGNEFVIKESLSREERARGEKGQIVGNGKFLSSAHAPSPVAKAPEKPDDDEDNSVPF